MDLIEHKNKNQAGKHNVLVYICQNYKSAKLLLPSPADFPHPYTIFSPKRFVLRLRGIPNNKRLFLFVLGGR